MADFDLPSRWLRENYNRDDRLAVVRIQRDTGEVKQSTATAEQIATPKYQAHLRAANAHGADVYVSMNTIRPEAWSRTRDDINEVRHIYLDIDKDGQGALQRVFDDPGMPEPHHVLESSPGKFQVMWQVEGFEKAQAESLMRNMAAKFGADPAATDCARVMRLPGFRNTKYPEISHYVREVHTGTGPNYKPQDFPSHTVARESVTRGPRASASGGQSRSEKDFGYAMRQLEKGVSPSEIAAEIAAYRTDKPNPTYYGEHTAQKAYAKFLARPVAHSSSDQRDVDGMER